MSNITLDRFIRNVLIQTGKYVDQRIPFCDTTLFDGTRVHIVIPPISAHPVVTLRKHTHRTWTLEDLLSAGTLNQKQMERLKSLVIEKANILVLGPTGCGKTTLARALLNEVPIQERIVVLEDTPELSCQRNNAAFLFTRSDIQKVVPDVSYIDLIRNSLRMRPDRLMLGEIRGEEAALLLDVLSTGHSGSLCTMHGSSGRQGIQRLESLVMRGAPQWPLRSIRQMIFESIQAIVVMAKNKTGQRIISDIVRPAGVEDFGVLLEPLY